jgi:tetratricopeptide (TPR) repeat protein
MRIRVLSPFVALLISLNIALVVWAQSEYPPPEPQSQQQDNTDATDSTAEYYANYTEQAMNFYRQGDTSKAIELMQKAYQLAPTNTAVLNNLAACYIKRGVYYQNTKKDYLKALEDYREALFYLNPAWPSDTPRTPVNEQNEKIIRDNIEGAMKNAHLSSDDAKAHLESAWTFRKAGKLHQAMVEYAWVTTLNPKQSGAWTAQGDIYTVIQKPERAISAYQKALDAASAPSDTLYVKLGTAQLKTGNAEKATESFNKALAINAKNKDAALALEQVWEKEIVSNPRNMSAHLNLGAVYQQMGRLNDAYAQYQIADHLSPNNPLIKLNMGSLLEQQGQVDQALALYDSAMRQNPSDPQALLYMADALKRKGQMKAAEQLLQKALQSSPDKKQVYEQLIAVYKAQGDPDKIKSGWQMYTSAYPDDASIQYQAGLALHELKDYDDAITYYQQAIKIDPNMADAYANMGTALHAVNRDDDAIKALKKALVLNPGMDEVKTLISDIDHQSGSKAFAEAAKLHEDGKYAEAVKEYELALKEDPKNADIDARYGLALQALKRFKEAEAAYDKAIALAPDVAANYYYKGSIYDEQNQLDTAKRLYEKALALDPNLNQAKQALDALNAGGEDTTLSQALDAYNKKNYPKSIQLVESVLNTDPNNATAYYYKGLDYDAEKKLEPARLAYEKAVELSPSLSDAVYALAVVLDTQGKKPDAKKTYQQFIDLTKGQPEDAFQKYAKDRVSAL